MTREEIKDEILGRTLRFFELDELAEDGLIQGYRSKRDLLRIDSNHNEKIYFQIKYVKKEEYVYDSKIKVLREIEE